MIVSYKKFLHSANKTCSNLVIIIKSIFACSIDAARVNSSDVVVIHKATSGIPNDSSAGQHGEKGVGGRRHKNGQQGTLGNG